MLLHLGTIEVEYLHDVVTTEYLCIVGQKVTILTLLDTYFKYQKKG